MPHAIRIYETGGPEKMRWEEVQVGNPGPGEVRVRSTAVGLNFVDTYHRSGLYPLALPLTLGMEGAGVVEAVGPKVREFKVGDRVAYANPIGSYAEVLLRPADRLVKIPAGVDDKIAAAIMLKGMTAWYLIKRTYKVKKGDTILVHAAAGGVGQILCQWAKSLGATVIGTVGSDDKAALAKKAGCKHVIVTSSEKFVDARQGDHQGQGCTGGLRRRRQGHLHGFARLPRAARHDGEFRQCLRRGHAVQSRPAVAEGLAVSDAPDAVQLRRETRGPGARRRRTCSRW